MARYRPDIKNLINLAETSYMMLIRLLGGIDEQGQVREFHISESLSYRMSILEKTRYTQMVQFQQLINAKESLASKVYLPKPAMTIRVYHDARIVEVVESQNMRQIKPRYDYPNQRMHQPDEKRQTLVFLVEWLQLCLQQGKANVTFTTK
ncbi:MULTISPECIES: DUF1249 domain-containing protein [unclassified Thalassotalea]|uniref:DUF1249 domain-containing protein n=1 Tax=unclassified Thalassotalea TaxID=2614972 RepID=UPI0010814203|nr:MULTISPECIES: DUF1249 domain-containing protein [unclassified Thalassotalea]NMP15965.1 DUF1249 domain-containing protein [Thalassotalea sp. Y01]QBY04991.1 DUF1249 domain-containing protein [Thalassotalea sp. HSM 43]